MVCISRSGHCGDGISMPFLPHFAFGCLHLHPGDERTGPIHEKGVQFSIEPQLVSLKGVFRWHQHHFLGLTARVARAVARGTTGDPRQRYPMYTGTHDPDDVIFGIYPTGSDLRLLWRKRSLMDPPLRSR
jgi:hypothetical protein